MTIIRIACYLKSRKGGKTLLNIQKLKDKKISREILENI